MTCHDSPGVKSLGKEDYCMEQSLYRRIMVTRKRNFRGRTHGKQMAVPGESALPGQLLNMAQWYECLPLFVFFSSFLFLRFFVCLFVCLFFTFTVLTSPGSFHFHSCFFPSVLYCLIQFSNLPMKIEK